MQYIDSASNNSMITYYKKTIQNKEAQKLNTFDPYKKKILQNYIDSANMQLDKYLIILPHLSINICWFICGPTV